MLHWGLEALALVVLIVLIFRPLSRTAVGALDGHAAKVRAELDAAKRLREEAQSLLANYQRQLANGEDQARAIIEHARVESERQIERQRAELEASLKRRTEQVTGRIAQEEARAVQELRAYAATLAIRTTERLLRERVDGPQAQALLDGAIQQLGRRLS
jgi:F-type H+-transporting ATPase subunit b